MADLTAREIFEKVLPKNLEGNEKASKIDAVYQFNIAGDNGGVWTVDLTKNSDQVTEGEAESPACTLSMDEGNFVKLWNGELNGMKAMMMGKLKIKGNMGLATKLQAFIGNE